MDIIAQLEAWLSQNIATVYTELTGSPSNVPSKSRGCSKLVFLKRAGGSGTRASPARCSAASPKKASTCK